MARHYEDQFDNMTNPRTYEATARAVNDLVPSLTALTRAVRSAQMVPPYEAFSMLAPLIIRPSAVKSAAPTRNLE